MSCTYIYNNKKYSKERLLKLLIEENPVIFDKDQTENIKWLKDKLGMSADEIKIVQGLIDNKSLGRFLQDGKILLSNSADSSVAYHEGFHRVWNMFLSPSEKSDYIKSLKNRKDWKSLIEPYRSSYPNLTDNELIEEYLADEFSDFVLNKGDITIEQPVKSFFDRLWNFLKKLVGLGSKDLTKLYQNISQGKYKGKPKYQAFKSADKVLIGGVEMSSDYKNQIVGFVTTRVIKEILRDGPEHLKMFIEGKAKAKSWTLFKNMSIKVAEFLEKDHEDLAIAVLEDLNNAVDKNNTKESKLYNYFTEHVKQLGIELPDETDISKLESFTQQMGDGDKISGNEFTSNIEVDPKSNMSKQIKILLGSLFDGSKRTSLGLSKPLLWSTAFNEIAQHVAGVPVEEFVSKLKTLNKGYTEQIIAYLSGTKPNQIIFRNEFVSTMANTINNFAILNIGENSIYLFDANVNTRANKLKTDWQNSMQRAIKERSSFQEWLDDVAKFAKNPRPNSADIEYVFGFTNDAELNLSVVYSNGNQNFYPSDIFNMMAQSIANSKIKEQPDLTKLFKSLDIDGNITNLATLQGKHENAVDMMVYAMGKRIYGIGLNTHLTTQINRINYAVDQFTPDMSLEDKLELIREYVPFALTEFNVTRENGKIVKIDSMFLNKLLEGKKIKLNIVYNAKTESYEEEQTSQIEEPDLYALHLNATLQGMNMTMKHSDRSTFMALSFEGETSSLVNPFQLGISNASGMLNFLSDYLKEQIEKEVDVTNKFLANPQPIQYFSSRAGISSIIGEERFQELLKGSPVNKEDELTIRSTIEVAFRKYVEELNNWGILDDNFKGINKELLKESQYGKNTDLLLATAFVSEFVGHNEEARFFTGDLRIYKDSVDLFKRLAAMSSTGKLLANDEVANQLIRELTAKQVIEIHNPRTNKVEQLSYDLAPDGKMRGITLKENKVSKSHMSEKAVGSIGEPIISKLTGNQESKIFQLYESSFAKDFSLDYTTMSKQDKAKWIKKIESYQSGYENVNENDGQSYMNLVAFKNYMIRLGTWTKGMENVFQLEMKIASLTDPADIENIEIEIDGKMVNPFIIEEGLKKPFRTSRSGNEFSPVHTLKSQYSGPVMSEKYTKDRTDFEFMFNSIFKTSYHILLPSAIIGTNLQLMNNTMLRNGIDFVHMGSANKVGGVDAKIAAEQALKLNPDNEELKTVAQLGLEFYNQDGSFNDIVIDEHLEHFAYLADVNYLKDQVNIGNKVKDEIKGSTQSLKIMVSNLIVNNKERFEGAKQLLESYKQIVKEIVEQNRQNLLQELDFNGTSFDSLDSLKRQLTESALAKSSPENLFNAIENFIDDPILETLPNKTKIENILYALVTNNMISFDRPGNSYPQTAITGYEPIGSRQQEVGKKDLRAASTQDLIKFYNPIFDKDGNVTKVEASEIILPLPDYFIEPILRKYNTRNLVKAIRLLNEDIANNVVDTEITFKGLRIPNQQLSSNDIFKVKKFHLPTMQNYAIVPSEIVVKVGSDFDVDKVNIYFPNYKEKVVGNAKLLNSYNMYKEAAGEDSLSLEDWADAKGEKIRLEKTFEVDKSDPYTRLLELEKKILLHPDNVHHLFMPVVDDIFSKNAYKEIYENLMGSPMEEEKSIFSSLTPQTNVIKSMIFVKGKLGVGIVARFITAHSTHQADEVVLNEVYINGDQEYGIQLLFEGQENNYGLNNYTDADLNIISEALSQLLTTQVDNVKDPKAVKLGINMQTLGVLGYLMTRGVSTNQIIKFLNQPLIKEYLKEQKKNESLINKNNGEELMKQDLIKKVLRDNKFSEKLPSLNTFLITNKILDEDLKSGGMNANQNKYLAYFLFIIDEARALSKWSNDQTADTTPVKDRSAMDSVITNKQESMMNGIVPVEIQNRVSTTGVISPFTQSREYYDKMYRNFYFTINSAYASKLAEFKTILAKLQKSDIKKDKARSTIESDFVLYFVQNYVLNSKEYKSFDELMGKTSKPSLAQRINEMKKQVTDNLVLNAFFPIINSALDEIDNKYVDNLRLFERQLTTLDINDFTDAMRDIADVDLELYTDLVTFIFYQSGLLNSPFNYSNIIPQSKNSDTTSPEYEKLFSAILSQAIRSAKQVALNNSAVGNIMNDFQDQFLQNKKQFLRTRGYKSYPLAYLNKFDSKDKKMKLFSIVEGEFLPAPGSAFFVRYNLPSSKLVEEQKMVRDAFLNDDTFEYTPENIESLKPNEVFVFGSNEGSSKGGKPTHGKGAALTARQKFGAIQGQSRGLQGQSYAVVTKKYWDVEKSSTLNEIGKELQDLMMFAKENPNLKFYVTKLGSSLAGYSVEQIKGLFNQLKNIIPNNIVLPIEYEVRNDTTNKPIDANKELELIAFLIETAQFSSDDKAILKRINQFVKSNNATKEDFNELLDTLYKSKVNFDGHGIIKFIKQLYNSQFNDTVDTTNIDNEQPYTDNQSADTVSQISQAIIETRQTIEQNQKEVKKSNIAGSVKTMVINNFNDFFPQYDYMTTEQKEVIASLVESGDTKIECEFKIKNKISK